MAGKGRERGKIRLEQNAVVRIYEQQNVTCKWKDFSGAK
jgi:hypothetical protein